MVKELSTLIPGYVKINRGHLSMEELLILAKRMGAERVVIVWERKGNPGEIKIFKVDNDLREILSIRIRGVSLSRELGRSPPKPSRCLSAKQEERKDLVVTLFPIIDSERTGECVEVSIDKYNDELRISFSLAGKPVGPVVRIAPPKQFSNSF